ncbi:YihY/virulence factor BrkB family protein [Methylobacter sp. S3L5C]|uniref:YihY/virulence factor BrkB family protein n=1 Tax=Methylobacter sp. S3L5C TaxID=2839024 RepID=UPI001FAD62D7|nr:YihY/virulence factor BrkB family protein [Methylobacter sp. S3L5C]UOA09804.1 YihY/virulence factor BrkB family protein [Methylobacter sp. S3L5C]
MKINLFNFIKEDIWLLHEQKLPLFKAAVIKSLKIIILSVQGFSRDLCPLRASALTLYSILSIVPVIAMLFGIAKGFGFEKMLEQQLLRHSPDQNTMVLDLISFAQNLLESTKGEVVAGIGIVVLFWTIINVIGNIEESFNFIWKIGKGRSISRKFSDYLSLMLFAPVLLIASSSITVFLKTKITWLITVIGLPEFGTWLVLRGLALSPLVLMIALFGFTFIFMPNHKIHYRAGIIAGIVTGILYHLSQWAYLSLQIGASSYNAIYGSFAALPLFVVWLQTGWMIVLFGCEVAFFLQNYEIYRNNNRFSDLSFSLKKVIALQITHLIIKNFTQLNKPLTATEIATKLVIPIAIIQPVLLNLISSHIIVEYKNLNEDDEVYQPAVDINILTISYIIDALEQCGQNHLPDMNQERLFMNAVNTFNKLMQTSEQNRLLKDI